MTNHPVRNGLMAGGILMALSLVLYVTDKGLLLSISTLLEFGVVIFFMTRAVSETKNEMKGWISFGDAFKPAWLTFILATTIATVFTFIMMNYVDPGLKDQIRIMQVDAFEQAASWFKISDTDKQTYIDTLETTDAFGINSLAFSLPFSFIFPGVLYAMVISLIMKKEAPIVPGT
ncbi:MAG: DUF4199 domain-containing protein [Saprospiraceae bacterium]|nr:DUF4199 domain-containing protein [Saprospiraceae bacterium]MBK8669371.1 DUF4199 domain-containing protein [Saprospiraceae bacterium]MBL0100518.1 DUF4199 domain-containing protein [Saprospiraceae bacterium]